MKDIKFSVVHNPPSEIQRKPQGKTIALWLSALGIVFDDIGTSPLYTFKTILSTAEFWPDAGVVLGALSQVIWTLVIVTAVKYFSFAMRVDNDVEGGLLALMALPGIKKQQRPTIIAVGLFGTALIYGDGAIIPAISALSALEGLYMVTLRSIHVSFLLPLRSCWPYFRYNGGEPQRLVTSLVR